MNKKTLVLGASLKPIRYSNIAINMLLEYNIDIVAIGLRKGLVNGVEILINKEGVSNIHTVTLYLNAKRQVDYYNYIVRLKPKRVIFNPGTENKDFYLMLKKHGIDVVVACTLVLLRTAQY